MWFLHLSSRTVFSFSCTFRLESSPIMFPSTIASYIRMFRLSRSYTKEILFLRTPRNWLALDPSICFIKNWKILMSLFAVVECFANGEQAPEKSTNYRYIVVRVSWFYLFSIPFSELRTCTPKVRNWVKQQIQVILSACRISNFCSCVLYYTTRWREYFWE